MRTKQSRTNQEARAAGKARSLACRQRESQDERRRDSHAASLPAACVSPATVRSRVSDAAPPPLIPANPS